MVVGFAESENKSLHLFAVGLLGIQETLLKGTNAFVSVHTPESRQRAGNSPIWQNHFGVNWETLKSSPGKLNHSWQVSSVILIYLAVPVSLFGQAGDFFNVLSPKSSDHRVIRHFEFRSELPRRRMWQFDCQEANRFTYNMRPKLHNSADRLAFISVWEQLECRKSDILLPRRVTSNSPLRRKPIENTI